MESLGTQSKRRNGRGGKLKTIGPIERIPVSDPEAAVRAQQDQIRAKFGRVPIQFDQLVMELNDAGWPTVATVHPLDFLMLPIQQVHKDNEGPYFYVSTTKVRPAKPVEGSLDLTEWAPPTVEIIPAFSR